MGKYRKKPVVIEAVQITDDWFDNDPPNILHPLDHRIEYDPVNRCVNIKTLEGTMVGKIGDWIIAGVQGEVYPCRADIFEQTYDLVKGRGVMDKDQRIAELEAELAQATTAVERTEVMYFKAEAKLERVREWLELRGYLNEHDCIVLDPTEVGDLERILAKGGE